MKRSCSYPNENTPKCKTPKSCSTNFPDTSNLENEWDDVYSGFADTPGNSISKPKLDDSDVEFVSEKAPDSLGRAVLTPKRKKNGDKWPETPVSGWSQPKKKIISFRCSAYEEDLKAGKFEFFHITTNTKGQQGNADGKTGELIGRFFNDFCANPNRISSLNKEISKRDTIINSLNKTVHRLMDKEKNTGPDYVELLENMCRTTKGIRDMAKEQVANAVGRGTILEHEKEKLLKLLKE